MVAKQMSEVAVSVIIPSYNGRKKLPNILAALEKQVVPPHEVMVVLDGSTDDSLAWAESYSNNFFQFRYHVRENGGRAAVRNTGANLANGDLLIFYDDDMLPAEDSVRRHLEFHRNYLSAICGGNQLEDEQRITHDFDRYRCYLRTIWLSPSHLVKELSSGDVHLTAANFSIIKKVFQGLDGFDEHLTDHEDLDMAYRALESGIAVFFDPLNIGWHDDFVSCTKYIRRRRDYIKAANSQGIGAKMGFKINKMKKWLLYYWFARKFWVQVIEKEWVIFLPKAVRFKLYSIIIWGLAEYFPNRTIV
jgi:glycosyltransferase involved in cell wall biosynthesis